MLCLGAIAFMEGIISMALNQTQTALCAKLAPGEDRRQMSVGLSYLLLMFLVPVFLILAGISLALSPFFSWASLTAAAFFALIFYFAAESIKYSLLVLIVLERQFGKQSLWLAGESLFTFAGVAGALWYRPTPVTFVAAYVAMRCLSSLFFVAVLSGASHLRNIRLQSARSNWRDAIGYGLPISAMGPLGWISSFLDRFIIAGVLGTAATGSYVAATSLVGRPYALTTAVLSNYFRPRLFVESDDAQKKSMLTKQWLVAAFAIGICGVLGLLVLGPYILKFLVAEKYREGAVGLMVVFSLAQTLSISTHALDNNLLASNKSAVLLKVQTFTSFSTLAIIPIGTAIAGPLGATFARCIAEAVKLFATFLLVSNAIPWASAKDADMQKGNSA